MISHLDMIARIALGAVLGGVIGFERDIHGRPAGLRTHILVSMGAATFMVVSNQFIFYQGYDPASHVEADVSRIAASVVSGIGFLAGGAILKTGATIQGLTTAAALWLAAAIGLCTGGGMYVEAASVTLMGLAALTVFRVFEDKDDKTVRRYVSLTMEDSVGQITKVIDALTNIGANVPDFDYERRIDSKSVAITFEVKIPTKVGTNGLIDVLEKQQGVQHVHIQHRHIENHKR